MTFTEYGMSLIRSMRTLMKFKISGSYAKKVFENVPIIGGECSRGRNNSSEDRFLKGALNSIIVKKRAQDINFYCKSFPLIGLKSSIVFFVGVILLGSSFVALREHLFCNSIDLIRS